jgi:GNAT superfamily N-acetyltransferase
MMDVPVALDLTIDREPFPLARRYVDFYELFDAHGIEARGRPLDLDIVRYAMIEREGRLAFFVARSEAKPVGYSCHYFFAALHGSERLGHDDIWYVKPEHRGRGIGRALKEMGLAWLREKNCVNTEDIIRGKLHAELLQSMGYEAWGTKWVRKL